ncbi:DNA-protecting protein DprA [Bacteroidetes/Chlorobi group bacterium MS-B_bin-24]|jgi:DNA processing protein|nr:MAG: DNA-protecting protein DprA [Bacteroidetes/Chlorobi group bacterium MS-B_bin-24]
MWSTDEILALTISKIAPQPKLKSIIENFQNFDHFLAFIVENERSQHLPEFVGTYEKLIFARHEAESQMFKAESFGARVITFWDFDYPRMLKEIQYPPLVLFVKGNLVPDGTSISMVGTRKSTTYGKLTAESFARTFAENGVIVTSGLAYGIDTFSHLSAIEGKGITYGVLANGLDCVTSSITRQLIDKIIENSGAVISEYKFGTRALPAYFPQRNRIISGISIATVVVESDVKGGAMITARFAFDQNREVFAVPGNINSPKSRGTNYMIKNNIAKLALSAEDVLYELGIIKDKLDFDAAKEENTFEDEVDSLIYNNITSEPKHIDVLAEELEMDISELLYRLLNFEFKGLIKQLPGKYYIRA